MDMDKEFSVRASKFENIYGYGVLVEMYLIGIMNFMVDVGFITQEDLSGRILAEMDKFESSIQRQQEIDKKRMAEEQDGMSQFSTTAPKEETQSFADFIKKEN